MLVNLVKLYRNFGVLLSAKHLGKYDYSSQSLNKKTKIIEALQAVFVGFCRKTHFRLVGVVPPNTHGPFLPGTHCTSEITTKIYVQ